MNLRFFICGVGLFIGVFGLDAKHIVGGDVTYECVGIDTVNNRVTFQITLTMYRDCYQEGEDLTPYDNPGTIGIYVGSGSNWRFFQDLYPPLFEQEVPIEPQENPCITYPPNLCVDRGAYKFTISLPIIDESYMISFQRCCRNNTINNIINPNVTGEAFTVEISPIAQRTCNNSPVFNDFPPILICNGFDLVFDHSARDSEGDQLVYEFCAPFAAGGFNAEDPDPCKRITPNPSLCPPPFNVVRYVQPTYSATRPVPGDPDLFLDPRTGLLTGRPNIEGQFVVGVCVKEFRDGELIGTVRRDFQFNVTQCEANVFAQIKSDAIVGEKEYLLNSCGENTITFENESFNEDFITSYKWEFDIRGEIETVDTRNATITFPGVGEYFGKMVLNEGLDCADTAEIYVNVYPSIEADFQFEYDTCVAGEILFRDQSTTGAETLTDWNWNFGDGSGAIAPVVDHQFADPGLKSVTLTVADNNLCIDEITKQIDWRPVPPLIVVEPSAYVGCEPGYVSFNNLSRPIDSSYTIKWDFGDGKTSDKISPHHVYEESGIYSVQVEITSPIGCRISRSYPNWIRVEDKPVADFVYTPEHPNIFNREMQFTDQSYNALSWQWNFNNQGNAFTRHPNYTFRDTGLHFVELVVVHQSGCSDTMTQWIDVQPIVEFIMPNAFTPNGDSRNDVFRGTGYLDGIQGFTMTIWDRWGQTVFTTHDPGEGWNGQRNNSGELLPNDVYVYLVTYVGPRGERREEKGYATLVR